jgi:hypothetical protein
MKDSGILILTLFVAITALLLGYGIGVNVTQNRETAIIFTGPNRIQWEVLLTGIIALAAGYLAYLGATKPDKERKKQLASLYLVKAEPLLIFFLSLTNPDNIHSLKLVNSLEEDGETDKEHPLLLFASILLDKLPDLPEEIVSGHLYSKYLGVTSVLKRLQITKDTLTISNKATVAETRSAIEEFLSELRKLT